MVGRTFFGLWTSSDERLVVFPGQEGRAFIQEARGYYNVVIVDAFNNPLRLEIGVPECVRRSTTWSWSVCLVFL